MSFLNCKPAARHGRPAINNNEFRKRRNRLLRELGGSMAILPTNQVFQRNRDSEYPFRPDSDFYYLTGFPEPEAIAVFLPGRKEGEYLLFCRERDPQQETWTGLRAGLDGAKEHYEADDAFPISDLDEILPRLMENRERVYYSMGRYAAFDARLLGWLNQVRSKGRAGVHAPAEFVSLEPIVHEMRLFKSAAEARSMRMAGKISAAAHVRAMQACRPGMWEYQIEAELTYAFMQEGARWPAYNSIVGGGANGCILHYTANSMQLRDGDLLLIDAAAEYDYYAADITRTFPVNGKFSAQQRALYQVVLASQYAALDKVRVGNHWNEPHDASVRVITEGLVELGILRGEVNELIEKGDYRRFFMHRAGHWLGMDVHDVGDYKVDDQWRLLEPGMVTTVEPGIYIAAGSEGVDERWWNLGIRIEDDVLVTRKGPEVLTGGVPKEIDDIEALMAD